MAIKKDFKIISDNGNIEESKLQEEISVTPEEKGKIANVIKDFFSSVKTLLREGAVFINESGERAETEEEKFLQDPYLKRNPLALHVLAFKLLPQEKADFFINHVKSIKMGEDMNLEIEMKNPNTEVKKIENILSTELKTYKQELPAIMDERKQKISLLIEASPEVKKYLENTKKS